MFFFQVKIFFLAQQAEEDKARQAKEKAEKAEKEQREKEEAEALKQAQIKAVRQKLTAELRQAKVQADRDKQALRSVKDTGKQKVTQHRTPYVSALLFITVSVKTLKKKMVVMKPHFDQTRD